MLEESVLKGRECLRTSGRTSAWESPPDGEGERSLLEVVVVVDVDDLSTRRVTACLDSR